MDFVVALGGLIVGFIVGLTGVGGGALMTPMLVLIFGVPPLAAVSSDVVASVVMKPIGGGVHLRKGTVNLKLVGWLMTGSLPCAFLGVWLLKRVAVGEGLQEWIKTGLGVALLLAATGILLRPVLTRRRQANQAVDTRVKVLRTIAIGAFGGLVVGMTSVGSGSLMIVLLLLLYPHLKLSDLVGTDLVQAVPLVASAALGHLWLGDFKLALTGSILLGAVPGVFIGAKLSSRAPDHVLRPALIVVLVASALKLLGAGNVTVGVTALAVTALVTSLGVASARAAKASKADPALVPVVRPQ
ncbi:MAG: sulfite exporter TauE/SafE family protein [Myxococcales bacterium]|jgi:uncharacterized membrane protein YfcA|nr:sulfite exporter TauE/SafE family protein [Myxococcales bacterium]